MRPARLAVLAMLLLALASGVALSQTAPAPAQGTLQLPRSGTPTAPPPPAPARTTSPTPPRPPATAQPSGTRPPAPAARPGQPPTVGSATRPPNRRPAAGAAAAGAAAGAAGAAAAAARAPEPTPPPQPTTGSATGLPLPRFAALRSDEVNMRVGPSTSYPIEWTYQRRDLPVQIIGEFQLWRRIRDAEGAEGWVHSSTLAGRRTVLIRPGAPSGEGQEVTLRRRAEEGAPAVARLRPGVIARVRECEAGNAWCELQVSGHRGFLRRTEVWGVGAEEEVK